MYRVVCKLSDGSVLIERTKNPKEAVSKFFRSYGEEVMSVEAVFQEEDTRQLSLLGNNVPVR